MKYSLVGERVMSCLLSLNSSILQNVSQSWSVLFSLFHILFLGRMHHYINFWYSKTSLPGWLF